MWWLTHKLVAATNALIASVEIRCAVVGLRRKRGQTQGWPRNRACHWGSREDLFAWE